IKSGGHTNNRGFSSTQVVQIAMYSFPDITFHSGAHTSTVGTGAIWDDVYSTLEEYGVNVVGPKVTGIRVGGIVLGGGMNYGLTIDDVVAYKLVLPNNTVNNSSDPDLFFGLRGGFNNFVCSPPEKYRM
ncbi:hypothetical protein EV702DRAFT_973031, partial [Suillus placidus]